MPGWPARSSSADKTMEPRASISEPQWQLCGTQRSYPHRKPTTSLTASSTNLSPHEAIGSAKSQLPLCYNEAARNDARWCAGLLLFTSYNEKLTRLVDVITRNGVVERIVEIVEQFDNLYRTTFRRQRREPDDIWEVDRRRRIHLRNHATSSLQFVCHVTTKQRIILFIYRLKSNSHLQA